MLVRDIDSNVAAVFRAVIPGYTGVSATYRPGRGQESTPCSTTVSQERVTPYSIPSFALI